MMHLLAVLIIDDIIVLILIAVVLAAAAYILAPKPKSPEMTKDESKPPTYAERGSYLPWCRGRAKLGPHILWVGDRKRVKYQVNKQDQYKFVESAWHGLNLGRGYLLREIRLQGKNISRGTITRDSHPSGSVVSLGFRGSYTIYWGEHNQGTNAFLGASSRVNITSRWPWMMYLVWKDLELGPQAIWPTIEYVIEARPEYSGLVNTPAWMEGTKTLVSTARSIAAVGTLSLNGVTRHRIDIGGDRRKDYPPIGGFARIAGNAVVADQDLTILDKSLVTTGTGAAQVTRTRIVVKETLTGITATGTLRPYAEVKDDGPNGAHVIYELLFAPWPNGMEFPTDEFHIDDLEDMGTLLASEGVKTHVKARDGKSTEDVLKDLMKDLGFFISFDPRIGKHRFVPIRVPSVIPSLGVELVLDPKPQIGTTHQEKPRTKVVYTYVDRTHRFRAATTPITDDASEVQEGRSRQVREDMPTVIDFATATVVSERRSLENEVNELGTYTVHACRDARVLFPGIAMTVNGISRTLRIVDVQRDPDGSAAHFGCVNDYYAGAASAYQGQSPGGLPETDPEDPDADSEPTVVETSSGWASPPPGGDIGTGGPNLPFNDHHPQLFLLRWRRTTDVGETRVMLSTDDTTFTEVATVDGYCTGGYLVNTMLQDGSRFIDEIEIVPQGPDDAMGQALSDTDSRAGKQLVFIGDEMFFAEEYEYVDETQAFLRGLIRARWGTPQQAHPSDSKVYVCPPGQIEPFSHKDIQVGSALYFRTLPVSGNVSFELAEVPSFTKTVAGRDIKPRDPMNFTTIDSTKTWLTGGAVSLRWSYFLAGCCECRNAAGYQRAGDPASAAEPKGFFELEVWNADGTVFMRRLTNIKVNSRIYAQIAMVADFGSEPDEIRFILRHHSCGYTSNAVTINVTRV